jgi:adenine/guanine/hypoxanthine permease
MAYILFVNPQILAEAGMPVHDVTLATAMAAAVATLVMGLAANYPFALAPGMGLNAYFTYGVVIGMGVSYQTALAAVFVEGLLFLLLAFGGVRTAVVNAIPLNLKRAITAGIGLFLTIIGFSSAGFIEASPATLVTLGDLTSASSLLAMTGLLLMARCCPAAGAARFFSASSLVTAVAWQADLRLVPTSVAMIPGLPTETLFALDFQGLSHRASSLSSSSPFSSSTSSIPPVH